MLVFKLTNFVTLRILSSIRNMFFLNVFSMQDCSSNVSNRLFSFEENFVSNGAQIVSVCFQICKLFSMVHIVCDQIWKIVFNVPNCLFSGLQKKIAVHLFYFQIWKMISQRCKNPTRYFLIVFSSLQNDIFRRCKQVALKVAHIIFNLFFCFAKCFSTAQNRFHRCKSIMCSVAKVLLSGLQMNLS